MGAGNSESSGVDRLKIEVLDYEGGAKTADIRALDTFYFVEGEQVFRQIREVLATRLTDDLKKVIERIGSIERLRYLHPADIRSFMRGVYVNLAVGYLLGKLHITKQVGEHYTFSGIEGSWNLPFEEAIKFLKSLVPLTREEYDRLNHDLKFRAFTIARVFSVDVINKIKERYIKALEKGNRPADVMQFLDETLRKIGVHHENPFWLETHARVNFLSSYNAGRWVQIKQSKTIKYLVYNAILDERTTKLCKTLDGTVKPIDDPFWEKFYPPNHFNCRSLATVVRRELAHIKALKPTPEDKVKKFLKELETDKQLKREFQFKGHTAKTLDGVPISVWKRAKDYNLREEILEFNAKTRHPEEWEKEITSASIKPKILNKKFRKHGKDFAKYWGLHLGEGEEGLKKFSELIEETKRNPTMVFFKFHPKGDTKVIQLMLARYYPQYEGWMTVYIYKGNIETAYPIAGSNWEIYINKLKENEGWIRWR